VSTHRVFAKISAAGVLAGVLIVALAATDASAEGIFDFLFGGLIRRPPAPPTEQVHSSYADPSFYPGPANPNIDTSTGRTTSYCVRLCDGRYFPMERHANASPVQLCSALCPGSPTKVFQGSSIDTASAPKSGRYADLGNAYVYRQKVVAGCTCNGKDAFGLAPIGIENDPTLRAGDMIVTADGVVTSSGAPRTATARAADGAQEADTSNDDPTADMRPARRPDRRVLGANLRDW
jgi:Protein of unknown function (DUF2865)